MTQTRHKDCPECNGQGTVTRERAYAAHYIEEYEDECPNCGGTGYVEYDDEDYAEYEAERGDWLLHKMQDEEMDYE
jgi:DnaJ-class molecular chaperone